MRISGTLLERLLIRIAPISILLGTISYSIFLTEPLDFLKKSIAVIFVLWLFDSILLLSKRIKRLSVMGDRLKIGNDVIRPGDLVSVRKKKDKRQGTTIKTIEFTYLKNSTLTKKQIITKPTFGDFLGRKTKTIDILIKNFPDLRDKIRWKV